MIIIGNFKTCQCNPALLMGKPYYNIGNWPRMRRTVAIITLSLLGVQTMSAKFLFKQKSVSVEEL